MQLLSMSSLAQIRVQDIEKQMQPTHDEASLTDSRNARSKQLLVMPKE